MDVSAPYDILNIITRIFIKLKSKWMDVVSYAIERIPKQVRRVCEKVISNGGLK